MTISDNPISSLPISANEQIGCIGIAIADSSAFADAAFICSKPFAKSTFAGGPFGGCIVIPNIIVISSTGVAIADSSASGINPQAVGIGTCDSTCLGIGAFIAARKPSSTATDLVGAYAVFGAPSNIALTFIYKRHVYSQVKKRKSHITVQLTEDIKMLEGNTKHLHPTIDISNTRIKTTKPEELVFLGLKRKSVKPEVKKRGQIVSV